MQLNSLIKINKKKIRVGRGIELVKVKLVEGHKGQKSRSGVAIKSFEEVKCLYIEDCLKRF